MISMNSSFRKAKHQFFIKLKFFRNVNEEKMSTIVHCSLFIIH